MTSASRAGLVACGIVFCVTGCYRTDPLYCETDRDCLDAPEGRRFCDLNGEYPASEGIAPTCIAAPGGLTVTASPEPRDLVVGTSITVPVTVKRGPGIHGDVTVEVASPPKGFTFDPLVIADGEESGELVVRASTEADFGYAMLDVGAHVGETAATAAPIKVDVIGVPGTPDLSFGDQSVVQLEGMGFRRSPVAVIAQGDKVVVVGVIAMTRLLANGSVDITFGENGRVSFHGNERREFMVAAARDDGQILVAYQIEGGGRPYMTILVARYTADGGELVQFKPLPASDGQYLGSISVGTDRRVVIHGTEGTHPAMWRLTEDLEMDVSFGQNGKVALPAEPQLTTGNQLGVHVQRTGNVVFNDDNRVRRLGNDGRLDPSFGDSGVTELPASTGRPMWWRIREGTEGILVAGDSARSGRLWRLFENGDLDPQFGAGGYTAFPAEEGSYFRLIDVYDDGAGSLYAFGDTSNSGSSYTFMALVRLNARGVTDRSYGLNGFAVDRGLQWFAEKAVFHSRHRVTMIGMETERQGTMVRRYWY
jgi:uncharacterized delta-60 repeat protein